MGNELLYSQQLLLLSLFLSRILKYVVSSITGSLACDSTRFLTILFLNDESTLAL
ncbi:hypothetical protein G9F31_11595 [Acinetobacter sp. 187]|uniref:hypothetical protein n=1 Tax=Acinetobacter lanii TaxID=2715163 RepID=UPI001409CE86|nr:hypothetical protein [Acinetobacter lanii]NHC04399.1 hypothetical protein [Acinetobacter lanii]